MDPRRWLSMPQQVEAQLARWRQDYPDHVAVDSILQYTGHPCLALTVADDPAAIGRPAAWFCVPHAHEPAGTAAIMDVIHQLLTGRDLAGAPAAFDQAAALRHLTLVFNPDANPGGRAWSPVLWWDGSRYSHEEMLQWNRGVDAATGGVFKRVDRWSLRDDAPLRRGIVYEQLNGHEFVEPNRDPGSSLVRLFWRMQERHRFRLSLHLHQAQIPRSRWNSYVVLPVSQPELPEALQAANLEWGRAIADRWRAVGGNPDPEPRLLDESKAADTAGWFKRCWAEYHRAAPELVTEVQSNAPHTPPALQLELARTAIVVTIERLLAIA